MRRAAWAVVATLASGCRFAGTAPQAPFPAVEGRPRHNLTAAAVADFAADVDYFPDKASFRHARQLEVSYHGHYKRVRLVTSGLGEEFRFLLVQRGTPVPPMAPDERLFHVPLGRFSLGSFRYGLATDALGLVDRLVAFGNHTHVSVASIRRLFDLGRLDRNNDDDALLQRQTEAHFNWYASQSFARDTLARVGIPEVPMAEHAEPTPLARSEWIKFFALFFNKEAEAEAAFASLEQRYEDVARRARGVTWRPRVLVNVASGDAWRAYGGRNVFARLIADAGGDYVFADDPSPKDDSPVPLEVALFRAHDADVWLIGPGSVFSGRVAAETVDAPRFGSARAVRSGRVYVCHRNYPDGPNPWWDEALMKPDVDLADHLRMLHPELLPEHELHFFRPLAGGGGQR